MLRRGFVHGSLGTFATFVAPSLARAQPGRVTRDGWDGRGEPTGREPADVESLTDLERSHVPVLTLPRHVRIGRPFDLVVQIGVRPHEMSAAHHIEWVEVCLDERRVAVIDLTVDVPYPIVRVPIVLGAPAMLVARARCNQHGVWRTRREIAVE